MKYYAPTRLSEKMHKTPEGYLVCLSVPIARTGVQIYARGETPIEPGPDGQVKINRDEKEVFRPQTIASFQGKAVTIGHPGDFVGPHNWTELTKGILQNVRRGEDDLKDDLVADVMIKDQIAIGLVEAGLREVSCGYEAEYEETAPGEGNQINIVGNHLALVEEGRAGPAYAITDHKGNVKGEPMDKTLMEKIKAFFKVIDEAAESEEKKKADDAAAAEAAKKDDGKKVDDAAAMDEIKKMVSDLGEKIAAMSKGKDADSEKKPDDETEKADDADMNSGIEDRLKALEMAVAKLMEGESEEAGDEESEEMGDEDAEEKKKADDAAACGMVGDSAARAEILAPGLAPSKDFKKKALMSAFGTKDGKEVIKSLLGGKVPTFDSAAQVDTLFIAASEVLKAKRENGLSGTKSVKVKARDSVEGDGSTVMTAEEINKINAKVYGTK